LHEGIQPIALPWDLFVNDADDLPFVDTDTLVAAKHMRPVTRGQLVNECDLVPALAQGSYFVTIHNGVESPASEVATCLVAADDCGGLSEFASG
jgi:hypothetical protein